jgi:hypothetical protein
MRRACAPALLSLALLFAIGSAREAAAEPEAARLLEQAIESFDNGAFVRSRDLLLRALKLLSQEGKDTRLLGRIHLYLGLNAAVESGPQSAKELFRKALKHDPLLKVDAERFKPDFVQVFEEVRGELIGTLEVTTDRREVLVWIDGARAGPPPIIRDALAGGHLVELRDTQGAPLVRREVQVQAGRSERIHFAVMPPPPPTSAPVVSPATRPVSERDDPPRRRIWTWVTGAGALAFLAVAIGTGVSAGDDHDRACDLLASSDRDCADRTRLVDPADRGLYQDLHDAVRAKELAANISWGVAGALAVTTVVLYLMEGRSPRVSASAQQRGIFSLRLRY